MKSGGRGRALEIAAIAKATGKAVYGGCMFETGIAHAAGAHLCAALGDLPYGCEFYMANYYVKEDLLVDSFAVKDGRVHVLTKPGQGIEKNRDTLKRYLR